MKKIFSYTAWAFLGVFQFIDLAHAQPLSCEVSAPIAILMNAETGRILYEKNAHARFYPASTTKIATAIYALHQKQHALSTLITASQEAIGAVSPHTRRMSGKHPSYRMEFGGTHMGLKAGEVMDFQALMYGLMLCSANDAANVIAEFVSGSVPNFMRELNAYLKEIGCTNTNFRNPHGLPDPHHQTTAYDMAIMTRHAMQNPIFREIVKTPRYKRPKTNKQEEDYIPQFNALLRPGKYYYPYAVGVKTGYTDNAGHNLVAAAQKGDRFLIAVAFYCDKSDVRYRTVINLFEAAFNEVKVTRKLFSKEHDVFHQRINGGKHAVDAKLAEDVIVQYYPSEPLEFTSKVKWHEMSLPIHPEAEVGTVSIYDQEGTLHVSMPLLAVRQIDPTWLHQCGQVLVKIKNMAKTSRQYYGAMMGLLLLAGSFWIYSRKLKRATEDKVE
jgi:serine-type D-Ala-D-Ala carboxypeptidase (penicillin-binding protein 5/6)